MSFRKIYSGQSPACGALLDATKSTQEIFSVSLCVCHKGMCVISVIQFLKWKIYNEKRRVQREIKGHQVCEGEGASFSHAPLLNESWEELGKNR